MKKSNLILKMTALPLLTGLALGGWQLASAAELACINQTKDSVATASASDWSNGKTKAEAASARDSVKSNAAQWAKEKLSKVLPSDADDEPAHCIGRCVDKGIEVEVGKTEVKFFEKLFDAGEKYDRMTPEEEAAWMLSCIERRVYYHGDTPAGAKAACEGQLKDLKSRGYSYHWMLIITASAQAEVTFTRRCDNPTRQQPASTGTQGTAGEGRR